MLIREFFTICYYAIVIKLSRKVIDWADFSSQEILVLRQENIALKAQVRALTAEIKKEIGPRPQLSIATRAAQVFAWIVTQEHYRFRRYYMSTSRRSIYVWRKYFKSPFTYVKHKLNRPGVIGDGCT